MAVVQIQTFSDLLTDLAEKVGETSQSTSDDRKRKLNSAYYFICNKRLWWFLEKSATETTTTAVAYALQSDFRAYHPKNPLKVGNKWYTLIPFDTLQLNDGTTGTVRLPQTIATNRAYIYGSNINFVQDTMSSGQTITHYYYRTVTGLDDLADAPLIPVNFREIISLYAAGMHLLSQGGPEAVEGTRLLKLFDTYFKDMENEDDARRKHGIVRRVLDPEEAAIYR